jgi:hypothetical protein
MLRSMLGDLAPASENRLTDHRAHGAMDLLTSAQRGASGALTEVSRSRMLVAAGARASTSSGGGITGSGYQTSRPKRGRARAPGLVFSA